MPIHHYYAADPSPPSRKTTPIVLSLLLKPFIMLFVFSLFLFLGLATISLLILLLLGSSLHLFRRRRPTTVPSVQDLQNNLPRINYDSNLESAKDCAVCLECFKEGDCCRRLPDCNHVFHAGCVDSWLTKVLNCPICRAHVNFIYCGPSSFTSEDDDFKLWWPVGV